MTVETKICGLSTPETVDAAVERGEGDIPLLIRRAQSARAGTHVSQVIPLAAYRGLKK